MVIGVPKEIKNNEYRVGIVPAGVEELTREGHQVVIETGAGTGSAISDADYEAAGAQIAPHAINGTAAKSANIAFLSRASVATRFLSVLLAPSNVSSFFMMHSTLHYRALYVNRFICFFISIHN